MKDLRELAGFILSVAIIWHVYAAFSSKTSISGLFKESPEIGYVWSNNGDTNPRFFWEKTKAKWQAGLNHPQYHVVSSDREGRWIPDAGYRFTGDGVKDLSVLWQEKVKHPTMNAYSSADEGYWIPELGYKFEANQEGKATGTIWNAGEQFNDLKITASGRVGYFEAFPGYLFSHPDKNLDVVWTPGLAHPVYPDSVSGSTEGVWVSRVLPQQPSAGDHIVKGFAIAAIANIIEWISGESNHYTNSMKEDGAKEVLIGSIQAIQEN
ncbi:hypothetical protein SAMN04515674_101178 [Pseudarcicella hirudinis]|uniref:Uncharacterized protein n=2 Tax=Pseudarcicella hirudinis TaxID=1079859 RepID=A0A1I5M898_9BACT|nr:hypothetical protein [Pseudarcicella hirudinis]SFP05723.1 hypothetical protein SAMN04515674_101178 [Pseudarcicella hirudinis]